MKYVLGFVGLLLLDSVKAEVITVTNVKVSVKADSAAKARETALDRAHDLAFQKLMSENILDNAGPLPAHDAIMNMVMDFSIDREKTTPTSYTASLTFQFDGPQVQAWLQHKGHPSPKDTFSISQPSGNEKPLKMKASYTTLSEWQTLRKTLENTFGVKKVTVIAFSPQDAIMEVTYGDNIEKLRQHLLQKGYLFSPADEGWIIASNRPPPLQ